jgi:hypothetical protein
LSGAFVAADRPARLAISCPLPAAPFGRAVLEALASEGPCQRKEAAPPVKSALEVAGRCVAASAANCVLLARAPNLQSYAVQLFAWSVGRFVSTRRIIGTWEDPG